MPSFRDLTVSPELAAQLERQQTDAHMMGFDAFNGVQMPVAGSNLLDFVTQLHFAGQPQLAQDIATMNGVPQRDYNAVVTQINEATASRPHGILGAISGIGNTVAENPALLFAAPFAVGGALGAFGAGAAGGTGAAAGGAAGGSVAGAIPAGYSGLATIPGAADLVVTGAAGPAFGGILGAGGGAAAGAAMSGGIQGPPEGPPEPQGPPQLPQLPQGIQGPPEPSGSGGNFLSKLFPGENGGLLGNFTSLGGGSPGMGLLSEQPNQNAALMQTMADLQRRRDAARMDDERRRSELLANLLGGQKWLRSF